MDSRKIKINFELNGSVFDISDLDFHQRYTEEFKDCFLKCRERINSSEMLAMRIYYRNLNEVARKQFLYNSIQIKYNTSLKRRKVYKRNHRYKIRYMVKFPAETTAVATEFSSGPLFKHEQQPIRMCRRCFKTCLNISYFNISSMVKNLFIKNNVQQT